jgi:hypothetical protein
MRNDRHNAWKRHTGIDSLFNGGILGIAIAGLLVAVLMGPAPERKPVAGSGPAPLTNA